MKISPDSHKFTLAEFVRQQRRMNPTTEFMLEFDGEELWVEAREEHHLQWKTYMGFIPRDVPPQFARRNGVFILNPYHIEDFVPHATLFTSSHDCKTARKQMANVFQSLFSSTCRPAP
jgi:hypothetical protein